MQNNPVLGLQEPNQKRWTFVLAIVSLALITTAAFSVRQIGKRQAETVGHCLQNTGTLLFINGTSPGSDSRKQLDKFYGKIPPSIIIDCSLSEHAAKACVRNNYTTFPTWRLDNPDTAKPDIHRGILSVQALKRELKKIGGCK